MCHVNPGHWWLTSSFSICELKRGFRSLLYQCKLYSWPFHGNVLPLARTTCSLTKTDLFLSQEAQTELVMLILLRLAEDVITFQTLPTQRRRDIQHTLTQNMESIFSFMMAILHVNVEDYRKLVSVAMICVSRNKKH